MASERVQRRIDRLLSQIEQEADQQNWERVRSLAVEVIAFAPDNVDARSFLTAADRVLRIQTPPSFTESSAPSESLPVASKAPTSFANGRYQAKRFLGEGIFAPKLSGHTVSGL